MDGKKETTTESLLVSKIMGARPLGTALFYFVRKVPTSSQTAKLDIIKIYYIVPSDKSKEGTVYHETVVLKDHIAHDQRWSERFFQSALDAEKQFHFWKDLGQDYLAQCLDNARNGHLENAVLYEQSMLKKKEQLVLQEKSM